MIANEMTHVVGYGALGREITRQLLAAGRPVTVVQRRKPADLPEAARFIAADIMQPVAITVALMGATGVIFALGLPYQAALWEKGWPLAMSNLLDACEAAGARLIFADNLYLYGPTKGAITEDLPAVDYGVKPKARAEVTRLWQAAHVEGRVKVAAVRSPDFYGPGVEQSVLGSASLMPLAKGRRAGLIGNADLQHDVAHVSDCARAVITLRDADDDAYGQAWHVPCAPTLTLRQHLQIAAATDRAARLARAVDRRLRALRAGGRRDAVPVRPALCGEGRQVPSSILVGCGAVRDRAG